MLMARRSRPWETAEAMKASETKADELRRNFVAEVQSSQPTVERYEVAVLTEIKHPARA